jgi:hypothetical protein
MITKIVLVKLPNPLGRGEPSGAYPGPKPYPGGRVM